MKRNRQTLVSPAERATQEFDGFGFITVQGLNPILYGWCSEEVAPTMGVSHCLAQDERFLYQL